MEKQVILAKHLRSHIGRLLHEVSFEGNARHHHEGGRGRENVLTVEVFQALDFLPRRPFFDGVLRAASGGAAAILALTMNEIETLTMLLLPGDIFLAHKPVFNVQPDATFETASVFGLMEVKRLKQGSFGPEQLAREYVAVIEEARTRGKKPLLLLVLPKEPPVPVQKNGVLSIDQAIAKPLAAVLGRCQNQSLSPPELCAKIEETVAFITWPALARSIRESRDQFICLDQDPSVAASVLRLTDAVLTAIGWHSPKT